MKLSINGKKITIYFDLDGVLVNLTKGLSKLEGYDDPVHWYLHREEEYGKYVYPKIIEKYIDENVFELLPPMPNFEEMKKVIALLIKKGYNVKVLSSCMDYDFSDKIEQQKIRWVIKHLGEYIKLDDIHIVRNSKFKIDYIDENSYLIDDYRKTQKQFIENGLGDQFIFYKNYYDCLNTLIKKEII